VKTQKPILHARDHLPGGADPIPGLLLPSGKVGDVIASTYPGAYYKLGEASGNWIDSSGGGHDAAWDSNPQTRAQPSPVDEGETGGSPGLAVHVAGDPPGPSADPSYVGGATGAAFDFTGTQPFTISIVINPDTLPGDHSQFSMGICGSATSGASGAPGWGLFILSHLFDPDYTSDPYGPGSKPARLCFRRSHGSGVVQQAVGDTIEGYEGNWLRITGVYDGSNMGLWIEEDLVATSGTGSVSLAGPASFLIGGCSVAEGTLGNNATFIGYLDSAVLWPRALTVAEILDIVATRSAGLVPVTDGSGGTTWSKQKIEVEF
jgi:hypothetical protein